MLIHFDYITEEKHADGKVYRKFDYEKFMYYRFVFAQMCFANGNFRGSINEENYNIIKEWVLAPGALYCSVNAYVESKGNYPLFKKYYQKYLKMWKEDRRTKYFK